MTKLNQSFITPFDREDIHELASSLDDVLDFTNAAANRLVTYKITTPPPAAAELADLIVLQSEELARGVWLFEENGAVLKQCDEVNRLEDEADHISRRAIRNRIAETESLECIPDSSCGILPNREVSSCKDTLLETSHRLPNNRSGCATGLRSNCARIPHSQTKPRPPKEVHASRPGLLPYSSAVLLQ